MSETESGLEPDLAALVAQAEASGDPAVLAGAAGLLYSEDRFEDGRRLMESAFNILRAAGAQRASARMAVALVNVHVALGNTAAAAGWLAKARRLLDAEGDCVEWGYYELAMIACMHLDVDALLASTERALEIAGRFGDAELEVRVLADSGLALVSQGRLSQGFARLDEALATICAGSVQSPDVMGSAFCSMLASCERSEDLVRAQEWVRLVRELLVDRLNGRPRIMDTHCYSAYGSVLVEAGRWEEAEEALSVAIGPTASRSPIHRTGAVARLAMLRISQGRLDEAETLLAPQEDQVASCRPLAEVHLRRGEPDVAAAIARRGLRELVGDVSRRAPLYSVLVEALLAAGDLAGAAAAVNELESECAAAEGEPTRTAVGLARGRVLLAGGDAAGGRTAFREALDALAADDQGLSAATVRLELAGALAALGDTVEAAVEARVALAEFERLGAAGHVDRTAALLRSLGVAVRPSGVRTTAAIEGLTGREREVLALLQGGATNAEIGAELYISPKTVEHHVGRILSKLGVRTRTEAAALAAGAPG